MYSWIASSNLAGRFFHTFQKMTCISEFSGVVHLQCQKLSLFIKARWCHNRITIMMLHFNWEISMNLPPSQLTTRQPTKHEKTRLCYLASFTTRSPCWKRHQIFHQVLWVFLGMSCLRQVVGVKMVCRVFWRVRSPENSICKRQLPYESENHLVPYTTLGNDACPHWFWPTSSKMYLPLSGNNNNISWPFHCVASEDSHCTPLFRTHTFHII